MTRISVILYGSNWSVIRVYNVRVILSLSLSTIVSYDVFGMTLVDNDVVVNVANDVRKPWKIGTVFTIVAIDVIVIGIFGIVSVAYTVLVNTVDGWEFIDGWINLER